MNCTNCGNPVYAGDAFCEVCGARINHGYRQPLPGGSAAMPARGTNSQPQPHGKNKNNNNSRVIIIAAVIAAIAVVLGTLYMGFHHQDEESMWAKCQETMELADVKAYIDEYPSGEHIAEAKNLYNKLIDEKAAWEGAMSSNNEDHLRAFINNHPKSKYLPQARDMLDDVVWNKALERNDKATFMRYINEFPNGKHAGEARSKFEDLRLAELTLEERDRVKSLIQQFLTGMEQWSAPDMMATCNTQMDNFMGKRPAGMGDVRDYLNAYRESDIDSIGFSSLAVDVKKTMNSDHRPQYSATFSVTRTFKRQNTENGTIAIMRGSAVVDAYFRFKEFNMDKSSGQ